MQADPDVHTWLLAWQAMKRRLHLDSINTNGEDRWEVLA